jgi:F-type H+-transporting ATPase subunit epsilon
MYIEVITPDKNVFSGEVVSATFPGSNGSFQVLNSHAPLISSLAKGTLTLVREKGGMEQMEVDGGVVEVLNNKIIVLAEKIIND